ncbi:SGNH/GDSL hydrolase family protein [Flagellimonas sp. S3867]|uniref:SGNH/GDSL hydrolase family protein n=1 Tax=Flagellimonas sp. S3867 TaxID=2768063 RepID=UPI001CC26D2E|nr:SGNH/GDSL hydrolase family protein [Flagellimonas sp. S3867]
MQSHFIKWSVKETSPEKLIVRLTTFFQHMNKLITLVLMILSVYSCSNDQETTIPDENIGILFIGNSLTYFNDLPILVRDRVEAQGKEITVKMVAYPNYAIVDHWADGEVQQLISSKNYDYVIIQQGPSSQSEGRQMLIESGKLYSDLCEQNDAKLCYFMVWPSISNYGTFDGVIINHTDAAAMNNSILLPVGEVWKAYIDNTNNLDYYGPDGFHPSVKGSEVAAEVIVEHLFN